MKLKKRTSIFIAIGIIISAILFYMFMTEWRVERVRLFSGSMDYVEEYRNYYYKTERKQVKTFVMGSTIVKDIYFKPGQKKKMLEKIKEDVINELEELITEHSDIFYKYEISDDFKQVCIYETPGGIGRDGFVDLRPGVISQISFLIPLYHCIKEGRGAITDNMFKIIESAD